MHLLGKHLHQSFIELWLECFAYLKIRRAVVLNRNHIPAFVEV